MTVKKKGSERGRGKPLGTRSMPELYPKILTVLQQDKDDRGDGMTAFAISKQIGVSDPTVRLYLDDLVDQKKISSKKILQMTLYRIKAIKE
jgi:response regulator of citrate/malate metabolism